MLIALISCVSKKENNKQKAKEMYVSPLFKSAYAYAKKQGVDRIFILSAKYGLLSEDEVIEPYDETLNEKTVNEVKQWAEKVIKDLSKKADLKNDRFLILAGERYRKFIISHLTNCRIPLEGLPIGKQLKFYKETLTHET